MTSPIELVQSIETAAYRSWPAREVAEYDGWELRFADGFSRRGNSVYPAGTSTVDRLEKLEWCRNWYAERGLDLVVRQTPATEPGLDAVLETVGFDLEGRTNVMVADLEPLPGEALVEPETSRTWCETTAGLLGIDEQRAEGWRAIIDRIELPTGFVVIDGVGAGFAVGDGQWLGLFEIVVDPDSRRQGWGSKLTRSLMEWGRSRGATRAYVQVVETNEPAIRLYERLGFDLTYSYWYRRGPEL